MSLLRLDEARELLGPHVNAVLVDPYRQALATWQRYVRTLPGDAQSISTTTRAGMIHDFAATVVRRALPAAGSQIRETNALRFFAVAIEGRALVRYKYVAADIPHNYQTRQQQLLSRQQYDGDMLESLALDGMPEPPTLLTCGYTLDYEGGLNTVSVQCDYRRSPMWRYLLWGGPDGGGTFEMLPLQPDLLPQPTEVRSTRWDGTQDEAAR